jgi:sulfate transport system ATP-binding protein
VRPHDVTIALEPGDARIEAMVKRVVHLGFEVRLELELPDGSEARAQLTRSQADELELARGDIVYARPPAGVPIEPELTGSISRERGSTEAEVPAAAFEEPA